MTHSTLTSKLLAAALAVSLTPEPALFAQATAALPNAPMMLHINILEGEEAINNIKERTAREPIVEVEDENHKPVAGVVVVFTTVRGPQGAGGTFNNLTQLRTVTDAQGRAIGRGFQPNTTAGNFTIQVTAAAGTMMAAAVVIHETNSAAAAAVSSSSAAGSVQAQAASTAATKGGLLHFFNIIPKWVVVGVAAGAAAAVTVAVTQSNTGTTISTGGGTVGAPSARPSTPRQ